MKVNDKIEISRLFRLAFGVWAVLLAQVASASLPVSVGGEKLPSLAPMLKQIDNAVVNIATYSTQQIYNPLLNDPFFRRFFNVPDQPQRSVKRQQSAGSGVIIDAENGTVVTNYHVVKGADEIHVSLTDGRDFVAELKGTDPELDIAVLKIKAKGLIQVNLFNSNRLEVGDFVVAIGNPFALGQTVTTGIVSALGRTGLGIEGYENFIQTDASINPGNSGGALVNLEGKLVGINTAIIAPAGGNVGIGFAIPINMVKASVDQILDHGKVLRGGLGIAVQDISSDLRAAFNLKQGEQGVLITEITKNSPADKAGLKLGDVIASIDGRRVKSSGQFRSEIGSRRIGDEIVLSIIRDGSNKKLDVKVEEPGKIAFSESGLPEQLQGASFRNNPEGDGVLIESVAPRSNAAYGGLRPGDVIVAVNRHRVDRISEFAKALSSNQDKVMLYLNRNGRLFYVVL